MKFVKGRRLLLGTSTAFDDTIMNYYFLFFKLVPMADEKKEKTPKGFNLEM